MSSKPKPTGGPGKSALTALSAYESSSSEEEQVQLPENDNSPKRQKSLSQIDLRRKLDGEPEFRAPQSRTSRTNPENPLQTAYYKYLGTGGKSDQRKRPTQLTQVDLRRKLNETQGVLHRGPVPQKMAPNCSEEHRQVHPPPPPNRNWWDDPEEEEDEKRSEDDTPTDKFKGNDSSQ